ncbi:hypothetical protein SAMN05444506_101449 [Pseudomonas syringae]|nr:hypothetical protein SAMN05444506_101449 [Pseudomonas syringae]
MLHLRQFIVITGKPARRCSALCAYPAKRFIRLDAAILGNVSAGDHQINTRVLIPNNVPSASANRWLSESWTSKTEDERAALGKTVSLGGFSAIM